MTYKSVRRDSITLEWEPPESDGGAEVTGYLIEKREEKKSGRWGYVHKVPATTTMFEVPGLMTGRQYRFRVRPINKMGLGDAIQPEEPVTITSPHSKIRDIDTV